MADGFTGGDRLDLLLSSTARALRGPNTVRCGFLEGSTYPDGTSLPMVAAVQEFGGKILIPAHTTTIYRKVNKSGKFLRNGRFVKKKTSNFATQHHVPAYTVVIPSRPFFRNMLKTLAPEIAPLLAGLMKKEEYNMQIILSFAGAFMKDQLQKSIRELQTPPNAKSTVRKKGFNNPLIETGHMLNSVDYDTQAESL